MADIAPLGFAVDTASLAKAKRASDDLRNSLNQMGREADKATGAQRGQGKAAEEAAKGEEKLGKETKKTTGETEKQTGATKKATDALRDQVGQQRALHDTMQRSQAAVAGMAGALGAGGSVVSGGLAGAAAGAATRIGGVAAAMGLLNPVVLTGAGLVVGLGVAYDQIILPLARAEDKFKQFEARLRNIDTIGENAGAVIDRLGDLAQETGTQLTGVVDSFARMARNSAEIGATKEEMVELTEVVAKLGIVSGAGAGEVASGTLQLSQALAAGRLNGDELRSIMENMPALAKGIAEGLGVGVGQLRAMGAAGELTSDKVFKALLGQLDKVNEEFANMPDTVERSMTRLGNSFDRLSARIGEAINASSIAQAIIGGVTGGVEFVERQFRNDTPQEARANRASEIASLQARLRSPEGTFNRDRLQQQIAALQALQDLSGLDQSFAALSATASDDSIRAGGKINRASSVAQEADDLAKKQNKLRSEIEKMEQGLDALNAGFGDLTGEARQDQVTKFGRILGALRGQLEDALSPLDKFNKATSDAREGLDRFGGGGGADFFSEAQGLRRSSFGQGQVISEAQAISAVMDKRKLDIDKQVASLEQQNLAQGRVAQSVGLTGEKALEAEAKQARLNKEFQLFGSNQRLIAMAAENMDRFEQATLASLKAQRDLNTEQALFAQQQQRLRTQAERDTVGQTPYERELARVRFEAEQADIANPGTGAGRVAQFRADKTLQSEEMVARIQREAERARKLAEAANDPRRQAEIRRGFEAEDAAAQFNKVDGIDVQNALRERTAANDNLSAANRLAGQERQLELLKKETEAVKKIGVEREVALARIRREHDIISSGVVLTDRQLQAELDMAEAIARQSDERQRAQEQSDNMMRAIENSAGIIVNTLDDGLNKAFETGRFRASDLLQLVGNIAGQIRRELTNALFVQPATSFLSRFIKSALPDVVLSSGSSSAGVVNANDQLQQFHKGGVVGFDGEPRFVDPSIFRGAMRFHTGGRAGGLVGSDEVPIIARRGERIVREGDSVGGGVVVQVVDQRSNNAPEAEVQESRGPDGKRMIRVIVREEVRNAINEGEFDPSMRQNFGVTRRLTRR